MAEHNLSLIKQQPDVLDRVCEFTERLLCPRNKTLLHEPRVDMVQYASPSSLSSVATRSSLGGRDPPDVKKSSEGDIVDIVFEQVEFFLCAEESQKKRVQKITLGHEETPIETAQPRRMTEIENPVRETHLHYRPAQKRELSVYRM